MTGRCRCSASTNWREHAWRQRQFGIEMVVLGVSAWTDARAALGQPLDDAETGRSILDARAALGTIDAQARDPRSK